MLLGPTIRRPAARTRAAMRSCATRPCGEYSAKPELSTISSETRLTMQASMAASTCLAGSTISAQSMPSGRSSIEVTDSRP